MLCDQKFRPQPARLPGCRDGVLLFCDDFGKRLKQVAPRAGFEPATNRLTAGCSTTELPGNTPNSGSGPITKPNCFGKDEGASAKAGGGHARN